MYIQVERGMEMFVGLLQVIVGGSHLENFAVRRTANSSLSFYLPLVPAMGLRLIGRAVVSLLFAVGLSPTQAASNSLYPHFEPTANIQSLINFHHVSLNLTLRYFDPRNQSYDRPTIS